MKSILDPSFRYTSSLHTDLRKTFERVRRERQQQAAEPIVGGLDRRSKVLAMRPRAVASH